MFQESLVESTAILHSHNRWPAVISFAAQAVVVAALLAVPLIHPEILPLRVPPMSLSAPLPPRPPQPPPPRIVHLTDAPTSSLSAPAAASAPAANAPRIRTAPTALSDNPPLVGTLNLGPSGSGSLSSLGTSPGPANPVSVAPGPASARTAGPLNISHGVAAGMLLAPIQPVYPSIARASRTEGTVVIEAIISKTGHIEAAHAVSGPIMLQGAAIEAVRGAHYRPFLLNNEPTEVQTTFTIYFRLNS